MKVIGYAEANSQMILFGWSSMPTNDLSFQIVTSRQCFAHHGHHQAYSTHFFFFCAVCMTRPAKCCIEATIWSDESFVGMLDHPKTIILLVLIHIICIYNDTCIAQENGCTNTMEQCTNYTYNFTSSWKRGQEQQQANDKRIHHCRNLHCLVAAYAYA